VGDLVKWFKNLFAKGLHGDEGGGLFGETGTKPDPDSLIIMPESSIQEIDALPPGAAIPADHRNREAQ
jgi:hypothetical protein